MKQSVMKKVGFVVTTLACVGCCVLPFLSLSTLAIGATGITVVVGVFTKHLAKHFDIWLCGLALAGLAFGVTWLLRKRSTAKRCAITNANNCSTECDCKSS